MGIIRFLIPPKCKRCHRYKDVCVCKEWADDQAKRDMKKGKPDPRPHSCAKTCGVNGKGKACGANVRGGVCPCSYC